MIYKKTIYWNDDVVHRNQLVCHTPLVGLDFDLIESLVFSPVNVIDDVYDDNATLSTKQKDEMLDRYDRLRARGKLDRKLFCVELLLYLLTISYREYDII
jgi:hypothetical protein